MGRTLKTTNQHLSDEIRALQDFRYALPADLKPIFDDLMLFARQHIVPITMANHALPLEAALLAMLVEVYRSVQKLEKQMAQLDDTDDNPNGMVIRQLPH